MREKRVDPLGLAAIVSEIKTGEDFFGEHDLSEEQKILGLSFEPETTAMPKSRKRRPGQRRPVRDPVGHGNRKTKVAA